MIQNLLQWIFPSLCQGCGIAIPQYDMLCGTCLTRVPLALDPLCIKCGKPMLGVHLESTFQGLCGNCLSQPRAFDAARSWGLYDVPLSHWIVAMKYRNNARLASRLAHAAEPHLRRWLEQWPWPDALTFVPLHRKKRRKREFNQAELIAKVFAAAWNLPCYDVLCRTRDGSSQVGSVRAQRWSQVQHVFALREDPLRYGYTWVLVDDVHTTGATLHALSMILKKSGIRHVYALTLATTPAILL